MASSNAGVRSVPNLISFSRLLLAAGFVAAGTTEGRLVIVGLAGATDFMDGWVARMMGVTSRWGALIDPIADRFFALTAVTTFLFLGQVTTLGYFVMISRDLMTAIGFLVARVVPGLRPVEFKARMSGKVVTVLQLATFVALLVGRAYVTPMLWAVGIASVWSIVDYTLALSRQKAS
ncbi:MAG: CDP-alcohol phosphatidyltransferase [Gemmatimonadetes bacterium]|nr:CDP-alcohol phosphatidyltransferase [Gemmatimonadota bacterium]